MDELKDFRKENKDELKELREQNEKLKQQNEAMNLELTRMRKRLEDLDVVEQKIELLEKDKKKNNIVISGLKIESTTNQNLKQKLNEFLRDHLQVTDKINNAQKINEHMYVAELNCFDTKMKILKNKGKIDYLKENKIFINTDLTKKEIKIQSKIREIAKEERNKGNRIKIGYKKLTINGKEWKWDKNENNVKEIMSNQNTIPKN